MHGCMHGIGCALQLENLLPLERLLTLQLVSAERISDGHSLRAAETRSFLSQLAMRYRPQALK